MSLEKLVTKELGKLLVTDLVAPLSSSNSILNSSVNITSATGVTITGAQLLSGNIIRTGQTAGQTDQLPSAAALLSAINIATNSQGSVGMSLQCNIVNLGSQIITIGQGTNSTLGGLTSITNGTLRSLRVVLANTAGSYLVQ